MRSFLAALACVLSPIALAGPPPAPVVTVGASDIKQLQFDWPSVPGVATYELWFRAAPGAQWVKYAETPAGRRIIRINVSVHLLDWRVARYRVAACNPSGCTNSAEVGVSDLALDAVGYLKPNYVGEDRWFGASVALSADGRTAAVAASELDGSKAYNGIVYVYRKASSTAPWRFDVRLKPSLFRRGSSNSSGDVLAVNGDGTLVAYGRPGEGIGGQSGNGAVYLFRRDGTTWTQEKRLVAGGPAFDDFGRTVDLDDSGNTLAVWRRSAVTRFAPKYGVTEIYNHTSAGWQHVTTIPVPADSTDSANCEHFALSGDGKTLLRTCAIPDHSPSQAVVLVHNAPGWGQSALIDAGAYDEIDTNYDGTLFATRRGYGFADVYRLQQNVWSPDSGSPIDFNNDSTVSSHGSTSIAMSRDGKIIAAGNAEEDTRGTPGPNYPPIPNDGNGTEGNVFVFERKPSGWKLRRLMKPSVDARTEFGACVALGADGKNMILGAFEDKSPATGIGGDPTQSLESSTGAAWLY
jgi:hypothetical protein